MKRMLLGTHHNVPEPIYLLRNMGWVLSLLTALVSQVTNPNSQELRLIGPLHVIRWGHVGSEMPIIGLLWIRMSAISCGLQG